MHALQRKNSNKSSAVAVVADRTAYVIAVDRCLDTPTLPFLHNF